MWSMLESEGQNCMILCLVFCSFSATLHWLQGVLLVALSFWGHFPVCQSCCFLLDTHMHTETDPWRLSGHQWELSVKVSLTVNVVPCQLECHSDSFLQGRFYKYLLQACGHRQVADLCFSSLPKAFHVSQWGFWDSRGSLLHKFPCLKYFVEGAKSISNQRQPHAWINAEAQSLSCQFWRRGAQKKNKARDCIMWEKFSHPWI